MLLGKNYVYSLSPLVLGTDLSWRSVDFYMPGRRQECSWKINQSINVGFRHNIHCSISFPGCL